MKRSSKLKRQGIHQVPLADCGPQCLSVIDHTDFRSLFRLITYRLETTDLSDPNPGKPGRWLHMI